MSNHNFRRLLMLGTFLAATPAFADATDMADTTDGNGEVIVVTGDRPRNEATSGTKSATPLAETPQSISVVTSDQIVGLGLQNLNQALRFVAGVTPEQRGASAEVYDQFKLRGFDAPIFLDGLRQFPSTYYAVPQVDVSRLDRIEVIKGPASVLYGQSSPGGLVAQSSKLPLERDLYGAIAGTYGNYDLFRLDGDVGGRATDTILWRVYGSYNGQHGQQRFGYRRRLTGSAAVTIGAGTPTSLTLLGNYSHDPRNGNYGVFPAVGTFFDNAAGRIKTSFYGGEPDDFFKRNQAAATYILNHAFGDNWAFRALGRYQNVTSKLGIVYTGGFPTDVTQAAPTLFDRASYSTAERVQGWAYDNQLSGSFATGPLTHRILLGVDRQVAHSDVAFAFGGATPIDAYNPVYGTVPTPRTPAEVRPGAFPVFGGTADARQRQQGVYLQDQIAVGGLRVTLSGRQDWARSASAGTVEKSDKFTYRTAALYRFDFGLAPYVSYATSFQPSSGNVIRDDGTLGPARPTTGKQIEAGAKYQVPGTEILVTAAWFRITQDGLLVPGPLPNTSAQGGKFRSSGVEVEASAPLPGGFNAKLAFSQQKVRDLSRANVANLLGAGRGGTSFNLEWAPPRGPVAGLALGGAVRYVRGINAGSYADGVRYFGDVEYRTPSYTVFDALLRYDLGKLGPRLEGLSLAVNATNIFDKKYLSSCYLNYGWCWYGNRRTVQGTIGYRF